MTHVVGHLGKLVRARHPTHAAPLVAIDAMRRSSATCPPTTDRFACSALRAAFTRESAGPSLQAPVPSPLRPAQLRRLAPAPRQLRHAHVGPAWCARLASERFCSDGGRAGVRTIILTNAAGGAIKGMKVSARAAQLRLSSVSLSLPPSLTHLHRGLQPGAVMVIRDHIRWTNIDPLLDSCNDPRCVQLSVGRSLSP
jgi:hypothetical protein